MERIDDLGINGLRLIQDTDLFCFGTDSVLLSDFARVKKGAKVVDLCSGNGIIPVLLSAKTQAKKIIGVEILEPSYKLAVRNAELNSLTGRVEFVHGDLKNWSEYFPSGYADVVTCNPPYMKVDAGFKNPDNCKAAARHEIHADFEDIVCCASKLLKFGGYFFAVHRADRLCDVLCTMRKYHLEPKRLAFVSPNPERAPNLILVEGMLGASPSLKLENSIYANI